MVVHREQGAGRVEVVVLVVESRSSIRVVVGPGLGHLDGGSHQTWRAEDIPADLRHLGARFWTEV